ncbi:NADPH-dependent F420 reductase [Streptomyces sp. t39]|uniref:NADPH-dependent F420 reductase n=1 Tax=Streptomyces sp. t39 TaxID=1828156 RepID=UPI0011CEAC53|nr:NAD(P)-binding domain-containing protein [Streptomyces sp. t39]TXS55920.1 oxidoreductase [Streptomyces sp. t39]
MTKIALIGTGHVGRALAPAFAKAGHEVLFGSREPDARTDLDHPVVTVAEAAAQGEIVVNATPGTDSVALLAPLAGPLAGKVLLDIAVGLTAESGLAHPNSSVSEEIQRALPDTRVVKSLSTMDSTAMTAPGELSGPGTVFVSGDDEAAKRSVESLLHDLGWPADSVMDLGELRTARGQEHFALLFMGIAESIGTYTFGIRVVR